MLRRPYVDLFLISFLILFFELAAIRWFASTVVFLTFFTNLVLLACFFGMSIPAGRSHALGDPVWAVGGPPCSAVIAGAPRPSRI